MTSTELTAVQAPDKVFTGLRRFNLGMGFLHLIQGILMIVLSNDTTYPIYTNYLKFNTETFSLIPDPKLFYELRFGPAVAAFLLLSAIAHFGLATFGYNWYVRRCTNPRSKYVIYKNWRPIRLGLRLWDAGINSFQHLSNQ